MSASRSPTASPALSPSADSKRPAGPVIGFGPGAWQAFVTHVC
ncbi:DUF397 domain-containing protein [Streptomyces sp. MB09-01]|nr:DUF397 domain-containing protein [Streptomyces sp. MB09-01]